jgi:hypothetical protein
MVSVVVAMVALAAGGVVAAAANASGQGNGNDNGVRVRAARQYVGYWMGIDPLDGGDSRRSITPDGASFAMIGRDTVFTLCDNTDRAIVTGTLRVSGVSMVGDDVVITCTNTGATVHLKLRYDPVGTNIVREHVTTPTGAFVDEIIFHRVSA